MAKRKLRGGMVGGGPGSFIGPVHRMAAIMDGEAEFVAGAFSSDLEKSKRTGRKLMLDPISVYADYKEMVGKESGLGRDERIDFVSIVTPNSTHFPIAKAFLEAGFNVICDKPMAMSLSQAKELRKIVKRSRKVFVLTHNYTGYPMVKQARYMVRKGMLGKINKVIVEYPQGWLSSMLINPKNPVAGWRMDPKKAGISCCMGDIGIHAENLVRYITGFEIDELCAELSSFIPGNRLDDDGNLLIRYKGGAKGLLYASQISTGEENGLNIRIYGTKAGLSWKQEDPNYLILKDPRGFKKVYSKGNPYLCRAARESGRLPFGHPDGFIEAFANIYLEAFRAIRAEINGNKIPERDFPTVDDGVIGNAFIETVVKSAKSEKKWTKMKKCDNIE